MDFTCLLLGFGWVLFGSDRIHEFQKQPKRNWKEKSSSIVLFEYTRELGFGDGGTFLTTIALFQ